MYVGCMKNNIGTDTILIQNVCLYIWTNFWGIKISRPKHDQLVENRLLPEVSQQLQVLQRFFHQKIEWYQMNFCMCHKGTARARMTKKPD